MVRPYAGTIRPGSVYERLALRAARSIVLRFYGANGPIFKKRLRMARPKISLAALRRMTVKELNKFISKHLGNWRKLSKNFQQHYTAYFNKDRYDRFRMSITTDLNRNLLSVGHAGNIWKTVFPLRVDSSVGPLKRRTPLPRVAPRGPAPRSVVLRSPQPRSASKKISVQRALILGVSTAMGRSLNETQVRSLLGKITKRKWQQLRDLGVVTQVKNALVSARILNTGANDAQVLEKVKIVVTRWKAGHLNRQKVIKMAVIRGARVAMERKLTAIQVHAVIKNVHRKTKWKLLQTSGIVAEVKKELIRMRILNRGARDSDVLPVLKKIVGKWNRVPTPGLPSTRLSNYVVA